MTVVAPRLPCSRIGDDMGHNVAEVVRLMLVTDDRFLEGRTLLPLALAAERGGVTSVQIRLKSATARELAEAVRALVRPTEPAEASA